LFFFDASKINNKTNVNLRASKNILNFCKKNQKLSNFCFKMFRPYVHHWKCVSKNKNWTCFFFVKQNFNAFIFALTYNYLIFVLRFFVEWKKNNNKQWEKTVWIHCFHKMPSVKTTKIKYQVASDLSYWAKINALKCYRAWHQKP
jgi:hypothetical protein